jgi:hypothetical protein
MKLALPVRAEALPIHGTRIVDANARLLVADVYDDDVAEHFVVAVNSHAALVEGCKKALTCASLNSDVRELIVAALALAAYYRRQEALA